MIDQDGEVVSGAKLSDMGFGLSGNPNYIQFFTEGNCSVGIDVIKFNTVSTNTECVIMFKNNAGLSYENVDLKYNRYQYQIMKSSMGSNIDGLDYSTSDGIYNEQIITYTLKSEESDNYTFSATSYADIVYNATNKTIDGVKVTSEYKIEFDDDKPIKITRKKPYVSFKLDDFDLTKAYSQTFIVGTMLDQRN